MANHRNRVTLNCERCKSSFWIIKSRENKAKRHFCSAKCRNLTCGEEKRLYKYPKIVGLCKKCGKDIIAKYKAMDKPSRAFCSTSCRASFLNTGRKQSDKQKKEASERLKRMWKTEKYRCLMNSPERKIKLSEGNIGEKSHFWIDGRTGVNRRMRNSYRSRDWRIAVFERDNYTCKECGKRSRKGMPVKLNADHIKPWAIFPELRFDIKNGRTLCLECHKKTDTFGFKASIMSRKLNIYK